MQGTNNIKFISAIVIASVFFMGCGKNESFFSHIPNAEDFDGSTLAVDDNGNEIVLDGAGDSAGDGSGAGDAAGDTGGGTAGDATGTAGDAAGTTASGSTSGGSGSVASAGGTASGSGSGSGNYASGSGSATGTAPGTGGGENPPPYVRDAINNPPLLDQYPCRDGTNKVGICHVPANVEARHYICIGRPALLGHADHGSEHSQKDYLGQCR